MEKGRPPNICLTKMLLMYLKNDKCVEKCSYFIRKIDKCLKEVKPKKIKDKKERKWEKTGEADAKEIKPN